MELYGTEGEDALHLWHRKIKFIVAFDLFMGLFVKIETYRLYQTYPSSA